LGSTKRRKKTFLYDGKRLKFSAHTVILKISPIDKADKVVKGAMRTVVYVDILICVNLIVNYFLLLSTGRFCQRKQIRLRLFLASMLGALYAMILFVKGLPPWVLLGSKLIISAAMVRIAYRYVSPKQYIKEYLVFFTVNFIFAGLMLALWLLVSPKGMLFYNGIVYFNISAVMLIGFTGIAYGVAEIFSRLYKKQGVDTAMYHVTIELGQKQTLLTGFFDTGNTLKDVYTGYPVVVCDFDAIHSILPSSLLDIFSTPIEQIDRLERLMTVHTGNKFKLIPYNTVGFSGILPAFIPDRLILQEGTRSFQMENVYVAVSQQKLCKGDYDMLLNFEMLPVEYRLKNETEKQHKEMVKIS